MQVHSLYLLNRSLRAAFTLIELSIVLVIVALLVGGILVGQSLLSVSQLRNIVSEKQSFEVAVNAFSTTYGCLPGDCAKATTFFGSDSGWVGAYGFKTANGGALTANGNGNGKIEIMDGANVSRYESLTAWQQLGYSGLLPSTYDGTWQTAAAQFIPGTNVPKTRSSSEGWAVGFIEDNPGGLFAGSYGHSFILIARDPTNGQPAWGAGSLKPGDLQSIDVKIDDGKPGRGVVRGAPNGGYGLYCVGWGQNDPDTSVYNTAYTEKACSPTFITKAF